MPGSGSRHSRHSVYIHKVFVKDRFGEINDARARLFPYRFQIETIKTEYHRYETLRIARFEKEAVFSVPYPFRYPSDTSREQETT